MDQRMMRRREAAKYLEVRGIPISANTLAKKATIGGGPKFRKFDRVPLYTSADLDAWIGDRDHVTGSMGQSTAQARLSAPLSSFSQG